MGRAIVEDGACASRRPPAGPPPKRSRWPWILLALLRARRRRGGCVALWGVHGGEWDDDDDDADRRCRVPPGLVGLDEAPATDELRIAASRPIPINRASEQDPGLVIGIAPRGGQQVAAGSSVTLYISKGVTVIDRAEDHPDDGRGRDDAADQHGLTVGDQTEKNDLADQGP